MLWVDIKYINLMSNRLRNFKRKSQNLWNFSCPFCGDSTRNKFKARGYVYQKGDKLNFMCHKCNEGFSLSTFIKKLDPQLHKEMQIDRFGEKPSANKDDDFRREEKPVFDNLVDPLEDLIPISDLSPKHFCREYVASRFIPEHYWDEIYFVDKFFAWANKVLPEKYEPPKHDEPRLVIPYRNRKGELVAFQGRMLKPGDGTKYIFVILDPNQPPIWGLDRVKLNQPIYAFEGTFDAMFVPNAVATAGSDIGSDLLATDIPQKHFVVVYDNEPRKVHTIRKIDKAIGQGFAVCIWPDSIREKDVNDMVKKRIENGLSEACHFIWTMIKSGTHRDLAARLALAAWRKV